MSPETVAPNVLEPGWDAEQDRPGFAWRRARIGLRAGAEHLGASVFELPPGQASFPYHAHLANEELLIVLRGAPKLRTPDGWRQLDAGDVVSFPAGEGGAHQLLNRGREPARILIVSQMIGPDVVLYPDSDKLAARERPPGSPPGGVTSAFRASDAVDYWQGEEPPDPE